MILDDIFEAMKPSDIPTSMRSNRLTMRDIEAERPQGAYRFRVGDKEFMSKDAADEFARGTGDKVEPIGRSTVSRGPRARFRVIDPRPNRPIATFPDESSAQRYATTVNGRVEAISETTGQKKNSSARIERILKQLRARNPQAQDDLEALIYDFRGQQSQDRQDIARLDQENDSEEADIDELQAMIDDLRRRRGIAEISNPFQQPAPIRTKDPITGKQIEPDYTPSEIPPQYANYQSRRAQAMARYQQPAAVPTATAAEPKDTGKSVDFGRMVSQLAAPQGTKTSTGGRVQTTKTGLIHRAKSPPSATKQQPATQTFAKSDRPAWLGKPITMGDQVIKPTDPNYKKIADALLKQGITEKKKPVPTNKPLWGRAKAAARAKFDVYPSAYANAWAAKWYKSHGGGWRMGKGAKK